MNETLNARLIELVKQHPGLYDPQHADYTDKTSKYRSWKVIAKDLNISPLTCKTKWYNIRDHYRRTLRKQLRHNSDVEGITSTYRYAEYLGFLQNCLKDFRPPKEVDEDSIAESTHEDEELQPEIKIEVGSKKPKRQKIETVVFDNPCSDFASYEESPGSSFVYPPMAHPVDAFLAAISSTLKNLSPYNLSLAKSEIFNTVQKYEMKTLVEETPYDVDRRKAVDKSDNDE